MIGKQGNARHVSKGGRQTERRSARSTKHRRLLLIWLAVLFVATAAPALAFAAPSNEDPTGGSSLAGIMLNPSQDDVGARASPDGDGSSSAWFTDPGEWFVASPPSTAGNSGRNEAAGSSSAWFTDPGEWFVASPPSTAGTSGWNEAAGSYSALRLAATGAVTEVASAPRFSAAAGSYGELRLAATGAVTGVASVLRSSAAAGSYGVLRMAAIKSGTSQAAASLEESAWLAALSVACADPSDDPVFGASSPAEAEFHDSQCNVKAAASQIGSGGSHRQ